jgi:protein-tyrosine phosphatase
VADRSLHGGVDEVTCDAPGTLWLSGKHFVGPDPASALEALGATAVVCLVERFELERRYDAYVDFLEADPRARWRPLMDFRPPEPPADDELVAEVVGLLADGQRVLVHCGAGIGRAGTLAAAVLIEGGMGAAEARRHVRACRPMAGPQSEEQERWLEARARRRLSPPR